MLMLQEEGATSSPIIEIAVYALLTLLVFLAAYWVKQKLLGLWHGYKFKKSNIPPPTPPLP